MRLDPASVIADLDELADARAAAGSPGAKRLAWTPQWLAAARRGCAASSTRSASEPVDRDEAGNLWAALRGRVATTFLIVGSHIDAVPDGGWLDGVLGLLTALEVDARSWPRAGRAAADRRAVRRLGRRGGRAVRAQPARLLGRAPARSTPTTSATCSTPTASTLGDALADVRRRPRRAPARPPRALDRRASPTSSCTSSRGRCCSTPAGWRRRSRERSASSGTWSTFTGQAAHAGSTPMRPAPRHARGRGARRRSRSARARSRHGGVAHRRPDALRARRDHGGRGRHRDAARQRHLDAGALAAMLREAQASCRRRGGGVRLHGRDPARVRRDADAVRPRSWSRSRGRRSPTAGGGDGEPIPSGPLHDATEIGRRRPDGDDLRPVRPAALARRDRGLARATRCASRSTRTGARWQVLA